MSLYHLMLDLLLGDQRCEDRWIKEKLQGAKRKRRPAHIQRLKGQIKHRLGTHKPVHIPGPKPGEKPRIRLPYRRAA